MTERNAPLPGQPMVCPFIALADDRDVRLSVPDHRHRCFAEDPAAQRALAHQAAYCLAAAFPACPTFADWARREAAPPTERRPGDYPFAAPEPATGVAEFVPAAPGFPAPERVQPAPERISPAPAAVPTAGTVPPPAPAWPLTPVLSVAPPQHAVPGDHVAQPLASPPADQYEPPEAAEDELLETDEDRADDASALASRPPSLPVFAETGPRAVPIPISNPGPRRFEDDFSRLRPDRHDAIPIDGSSATSRAGWSDPPPWIRERGGGAPGDRPAGPERADDPADGNRFDRSFGGYAAPAHDPGGPPPPRWSGADAGSGRPVGPVGPQGPVGPGSDPRPARREPPRPAARSEEPMPRPVPPTGPQPGATPPRGGGRGGMGRPSTALWGDGAAAPTTPPTPPATPSAPAAPQRPAIARTFAPPDDTGVPSPGQVPDAQGDVQDPRSSAVGGTGPAPRRPASSAIGYAPVPDPSHGRGVKDVPAPSWERPRKVESYPQLKSSGAGFSLPLKLGLGLVLVVAIVFSIPFLLKAVTSSGNSGATGPTPSLDASASALATPRPTPTPTPAPTPATYTVRSNDTMSKIAKKFGLTIEQLMAANPQIKNPDKIKLGDKINVPAANPSTIIKSATPTPAPTK